MAYGVSDTAIGSIFIDAEIAQLVEQRIRNAWVRGSSPLIGFVSDTFCIGYPMEDVSFLL